jgi:hypothetical protein
MSFGFSVGDFVGTAQLAFNLYTYCYKVARDAPQEFKLLVAELGTMHMSIELLARESMDPESTLMCGGEDRVRMMHEMLGRVKVTLGELQKHADKYKKLGDSRSSLGKAWAQFKWSVDAADLDSLRNKVSDSRALLMKTPQVRNMWLIFYSWFTTMGS